MAPLPAVTPPQADSQFVAKRGTAATGSTLKKERGKRVFFRSRIEACAPSRKRTTAAVIIGPKVIRGRVVSFSVRCMALVAAVPLRVARLGALYGDAEAEPPHREFGVIEEAVRAGERHASDYRPGEAVSRSWDGFVADSPLEGAGFEPSVPRQIFSDARRSPRIHLPQYKPAPSRQGPMVRIHLPPAKSAAAPDFWSGIS